MQNSYKKSGVNISLANKFVKHINKCVICDQLYIRDSRVYCGACVYHLLVLVYDSRVYHLLVCIE